MPVEDWISQPPVASERHEREIQATPERAIELALGMEAGGDPIVGGLFRLRGMRPGGTLEEFFETNGFIFLKREPREVIVGIGAPAQLHSAERIRDPQDWLSWDRPGWLKAAANFAAEPLGGSRCRLVTETQVEATDAKARRRFRAYWLAIGPFSALIRRRWLRQIAKAAERD